MAGGMYVVGRDHRSDVVLADDSVSSRHARFDVDVQGRVWIQDLGSTNGTFVAGGGAWHRVGSAPMPVEPTTFVLFGSCGADVSSLLGLGHGSDGMSGRRHITDRAPAQFGFYRPFAALSVPADRGTWVSFAMLGLGTFMFLLELVLRATSLGTSTALVAAFAAFVPVVFYTSIWLWLDRYDPEPVWALAAAFAWGAGVSIFFAGTANSIFSMIVGAVAGPEAGYVLGAIISAPLTEEGSKAAGLVLIVVFLRRHFDGMLDGLVYAGMIALGFATVENIQYYGTAIQQQQLLGTFFLRGVLAPFSHSLFTSMTGIGLGLAREFHRPLLKWLLPVAGLLSAIVLHSLWNTIATLFRGDAYFVAYVVFWVPLFAAFVGFIIYLMRRELLILRKQLAIAVSEGLLTMEQLRIASSILGRIAWLASSLGDLQRFNARRRFLRACSRYGLCQWHVERAVGAGGQTMSVPEVPLFRDELASLRSLI